MLLSNYRALPTLDINDRTSSLQYYNAVYDVPTPTIGWDGDVDTCDAGTTSAAFREAVRLRINYFREMAGIAAHVTLDDALNAQAQEAALMMSAQGSLSHGPSSSWACYSTDGAAGAGASNLTLGLIGPDAVSGLMQGAGIYNYAVGHRRLILLPELLTMGTGDVPSTNGRWSSNALFVYGELDYGQPTPRDTFVAWPPPGYVPHQVVYPRWSFGLQGGADFSNATVAMTKDGTPLDVELEPYVTGYGHNTLVWIPDGMVHNRAWPVPTSDTVYDVTIGNVIVNGTAESFSYSVIVFAE